MSRAVRHIRGGQPGAAFETLKKVERTPERDGGVVDAMLAYCSIGVGDTESAKSACKRVLQAEKPKTADRQFVEQFCRYLSAVLANDYQDYVRQRQKLRAMPCSSHIKEALPLGRLFVLDPAGKSVN